MKSTISIIAAVFAVAFAVLVFTMITNEPVAAEVTADGVFVREYPPYSAPTVVVDDNGASNGIFTGAYDITAWPGELELVADIVWLECRGESAECQRAITEVIFNRVRSGIWGKTITDVIYAVDSWCDYYEFSTVPLLGTVAHDDTYWAIIDIVLDVFVNGVTIPARVMWFRADYYHGWAIDEFAIGRAYFSSSPWASVGE